MKEGMDVLGSPSLIILIISVDVKQPLKKKKTRSGAQELCKRRDGRPGLSVSNSQYCLCGHKSTLKPKPLRCLDYVLSM